MGNEDIFAGIKIDETNRERFNKIVNCYGDTWVKKIDDFEKWASYKLPLTLQGIVKDYFANVHMTEEVFLLQITECLMEMVKEANQRD